MPNILQKLFKYDLLVIRAKSNKRFKKMIKTKLYILLVVFGLHLQTVRTAQLVPTENLSGHNGILRTYAGIPLPDFQHVATIKEAAELIEKVYGAKIKAKDLFWKFENASGPVQDYIIEHFQISQNHNISRAILSLIKDM
jgi:hypothetical protein